MPQLPTDSDNPLPLVLVFTPVPQLPTDVDSPLLPVMVFIYGGGFTTGGSSLYYPDRLQRNKDVVVVTPHYRLGVLGESQTHKHASVRVRLTNTPG